MVLRPQIITTRNILTSLIAPAGARVAALVGSAIWGPENSVVALQNTEDFVNTFGDDKSGTGVTGVKGASLFFANGGTLKFVRVTDSNAAKSDYTALNGATQVIVFEAKYKGTYGDNITVEIVVNGSNRDVKITDGKILELFTNNGSGYATNQAIEDAVTAGSNLVVATAVAGQETINLADAITATQFTGGNDGEASLSDADYTTAFDNLLLTEDYNFLLMPGKPGDAFHATMVGKLNARASAEKKYSRYITGIALDETIATAVARTSSGKRLSLRSPGVKHTHRVDATVVNLDGSYHACAYAGMLCRLDLNTSGTHETISVEGLVVDSTSGKEFYTKAEQEQLLQGRIGPISKVGNAIQCVRAVTRAANVTDFEFEEVIVDILDNVQTDAEAYLDTVIGKPNTSTSRALQAGRLDAIMTAKKNAGIIEDFQQSTVSEGASRDTINAAVNPRPTANTNFIRLSLNAS